MVVNPRRTSPSPELLSRDDQNGRGATQVAPRSAWRRAARQAQGDCGQIARIDDASAQQGLTFRSHETLQENDLIHSKTNDLADRRTAATDAKAALLESYRAKMAANDPTRLARQEERRGIAAARAERHAEQARLAREKAEQEQRRIEAEAADRLAAAEAVAQSEKSRRSSVDGLVARVVKDEATRKADRDRRYANRKAQRK